MNWLRHIVGQIQIQPSDSSKNRTTQKNSNTEIINIPFSDDLKYLSDLWLQFKNCITKDPLIQNEETLSQLKNFLKEFKNVYKDWGSTNFDKSFFSEEDFSTKSKLGHPTEVVETIAKILNSNASNIAVALRGLESEEKFVIPNFYEVIEIIEIMSRTPHNRKILKKEDIFPHVVTLMNAGNVLVNLIVRKHSKWDIKSSPVIKFVKEFLTHLFKIYAHFCEAYDPLGGTMFKQTGRNVMLVKRRLQQPNLKAQQLEMVDYIAKSQGIIALIDMLMMFQRVIPHYPSLGFLFAFQEAALHIVLAIMLVTEKDKLDMYSSTGGLSALVSLLKWPLEVEKEFSEKQWDKVDVKSLDLDRLNLFFETQNLTLRILVEALVSNPEYVVKLGELGLFDAIVDMGVWVASIFNLDETAEGFVDALRENPVPSTSLSLQSGGSRKGSMDIVPQQSPDTTSFRKFTQKTLKYFEKLALDFPSPGFIKKIANRRILQFVECVSTLVADACTNFNFDTQLSLNSPKPETEPLEYYQLMTLCLLLKLFIDKKDSPKCITEARKKLTMYSDLQLYFMDSIIIVVTKNPKTLDIFVENGLYDIFFSEYFYFFGGKYNPVNNSGEKKQDSKNVLAQVASGVLRESVISFFKFAISTHNRKCIIECRKLIEILAQHRTNSELVCELGTAILDVMYHRHKKTQAAMYELKALSVISHVVEVQHTKLSKLPKPSIGDLDPHPEYEKTLKARNIVLSLMDILLSGDDSRYIALSDANTVNTLFLCLFDPTLENYGKDHIMRLLETPINDPKAFELLLGTYTDKLVGLASKEHISDYDMRLVMKMLQAIEKGMNDTNRQFIQFELKDKLDKFVHLLNMSEKKFKNTNITPHDLCIQVLKTLAVLLADNPQTKQYFANTVGYDTLKDIILRCENNKPSHELFAQLFNMLVEDKFDVETCCTIKNPQIIPLMFKLCLHCDESFVSEFINIFVAITENNISNQNSCYTAHLMDILLEMVPKYETSKSIMIQGSERLRDNIIYLVEILGKHSITVKELKKFFSLLKEKSKNATSTVLPHLLKAVQAMTHNDPEAFFDFDGKSSGLKLPILNQWPTPKGYTICMWLRIETFEDTTGKTKYKPLLFSFLNTAGEGIECYFERSALSFSLISAGGKQVTTKQMDFAFSVSKLFFLTAKTREWYYITLVHTSGGTFTKSEMKLFVDGKQTRKAALKYPSFNKPLDKCYIATNAKLATSANSTKETSSAAVEAPLTGQMGAIYIFDDVLSSHCIYMMYNVGPNYISTFQPVEADLFHKSLSPLFDGYLSQKLFLAYNPKSRKDYILFNNSINSSQDLNAEMLSGTRPCVIHNVKDIIGCLGGIKVLFPLFLQMDMLSHTENANEAMDPYLVNELISLIKDLLRDHKDNQDDMVRCKGFQVINFLLRMISPQHLTQQTVLSIPSLLDTVKDNPQLFADCVVYLCFDFKLWIYTKPDVQKQLIAKLIVEVENDPQRFRKLIGVQMLMDMMRWFYWYTKENKYSLGTEQICNPVTKECLGQRPPAKEVADIRVLLFSLVKSMVGSSITHDEVECIIRFLSDCADHLQLVDVLKFLFELMLTNNGSAIAEYISNCGGYEVLVQLLKNKAENVRIFALKCIGKFLILHPKSRQKLLADQVHGFAHITHILQQFPFTKQTYHALRDIFVGGGTLNDTMEISDFDDETSNFEISSVLCTIFTLLSTATTEIRHTIIQDWKRQLNSPTIRGIFLKQTGWPNWLFKIMVAKSEEELDTNLNPIIQDNIIDVITIVLNHALVNEKHGWKKLEEILLYLHQYEYENLLDSNVILGKMYNRLLDRFIASVESKQMEQISFDINNKQSFQLVRNYKSDSHASKSNLLHMITFIEEFVFYNYSLQRELFGGVSSGGKRSSESLLFETPPSKLERKKTTPPKLHIRSLGSFSFIQSPGTPSTGGSQPSTPATPTESLNTPPQTKKDLKKLMSHSSPQLRGNSKTTPEIDIRRHTMSFYQPIQRDKSKRLLYDAEEEIRLKRDKNGNWIDLGIIEKVLQLLDVWKLSSVASFGSLGNLIQSGKSHLRRGGTLRIALRFIRYSLRENPVLNLKNLEYIQKIIQRDIQSEQQMQRFSELWAVTGDMEESDDFQNRLFYILAFLLDTLSRQIELGNSENAVRLLFLLKQIFTSRRKILEHKLKTESGTKILSNEFIFLNPRKTDIQEFITETSTKEWQYAWSKYFVTVVRKLDTEEAKFLHEIVTRRKQKLLELHKTVDSLYTMETEHKSKLLAEVEKISTNVQTAENTRKKLAFSKYQDSHDAASNLWKRVMRNVSNERGAWGTPNEDPKKVYWKLDKTENSRRMRLKLKRDYNGTDHAGCAQSTVMRKTKKMLEQEAKQMEKKNEVNDLLKVKGNTSFFIPKLAKIVEEEEVEEKIEDKEEKPDFEEIPVEEKSLIEVYCEYITPMQAFSGRMEVTTKRIIFLVDKVNQCVEFGQNAITSSLHKRPKDKVLLMEHIREIHLRRHRLQRSAIEIFMTNCTNFFFNFKQADRNKVYKKILSARPPNLTVVDSSLQSGKYLGLSDITKMWQRRQISNFDYLMKLNTFAGRTYNDLSQYPVFPWIIADYTSEKLDLTNEKTFRNLSRPMGIQRDQDISVVERRFTDFADPDIPPFHYGTHYSNPAIVLYYLIRLEPFTTYSRILQGGVFDHADRLFDSWQQTWSNCLTSGSDFKEMIPECFYLPEFLYIRNNVDLGTTQSKKKLGNVVLPPWAESAEQFIRLNREALESDYVSEHLHEWIDLIFGYKQRGKEAVKALNVFYYLTYEGSVDINEIKDEHKRRGVIAQIENFGQCPTRIFTKPHPKRLKIEEALRPFLHQPKSLTVQRTIAAFSRPIVFIKSYQDKLTLISDTGEILLLKLSALSEQPKKIPSIKIPGLQFSYQISITSSCFDIPSNNKDIIFSCGHWDNSFKCSTTTNPAILQSIWRHKGLVTCIAICGDDKTLVTGSTDTTLMVWEFSSGKHPIQPQPRHILYGHDDEVTCVAASSDLDVAISGSKDKTCIIHTLRQGRYVRTITLPSGGSIDQVAVSDDGHVVIFSNEDMMIYLYSINGKLLKSVDAGQNVNALMIHECKYLVYGGDSGIVFVRRIYDLHIVCKYDLRSCKSSIRSLSIATDERHLIVGLANGTFVILAPTGKM